MLTEIRIEPVERDEALDDADEQLACLKREFPTIAVTVRPLSSAHRDRNVETLRASGVPSPPYLRPGTEVVIAARAWQKDPWDPWAFDSAIVSAIDRAPAALRIQGDPFARQTALGVLTRYQRFIMRRNEASIDRRFFFVLRRHGELYDRRAPLARAAYEHALDAWAWLLRLCPEASLSFQLAILFHDIEGLLNGIGGERSRRSGRRDQRSAGPQIADDIMASCGIDEQVRGHTVELISEYAKYPEDGEIGPCSPEVLLLSDASALAFFSIMSPPYSSHLGPERTRRKVESVLLRLRSCQRPRLATMRLLPQVEQMLGTLMEHGQKSAFGA